MRRFSTSLRLVLCLSVLFVLSPWLRAREIHISKAGSDTAAGTADNPYLTIGKAAEVAQPGDTVVVHEGTYREWVRPKRGGTSDDKRITYRAAPGETVIVKGSEHITDWERDSDHIWHVELPNAFFGDYNPYALQVSGPWLNYGQWHHRGDVYLDGKALFEKRDLEEVRGSPLSWWCQVGDDTTRIVANFGDADPNERVVEINVRESLFMPAVTGLDYITVDGFHFQHAAPNWAPPTIPFQPGAVGPRMGKGWIIENCTVTDSRCVGIILGQSPGADGDDIDTFGAHIVRNNIIRRCGQAGIAGLRGPSRSVISGNLIEDTNYRKEFGGWETAAIKFHLSVDTVIRGNLIRGVFHQIQGAFGIWMDFGNQGTRITGNLIYHTEAEAIFLEMDHGPILVDNNIVIGGGVRSNSENTVFAHNLFVDCPWNYRPDTRRRSQYYTPHTTIVVGRKQGVPANDHFYYNLFVRKGLEGVRETPGFIADYNVFCEGAQKSVFEKQHSIVMPLRVDPSIDEQPLGAVVRFTGDEAIREVSGPWVDAELVGVFPTVNQTLEDRDGKPIRVDTDFFGTRRDRPVPGPLATIRSGENTVTWQLSTRNGKKK